jgi:hypothetical protein
VDAAGGIVAQQLRGEPQKGWAVMSLFNPTTATLRDSLNGFE